MSKWYPIGSYSFRVIIGNRKIGFSRVSGIKLINPSKNSVNISVLKQGTPQITRVIGVETDDQDQVDSVYTSRSNILTLEKALQKNKQNTNQRFLLDLYNKNVDISEIKIEVLDASRNVAAVLTFQQCSVIAYELSDLNAVSGDYIKQIIKIQYQCSSVQTAEN